MTQPIFPWGRHPTLPSTLTPPTTPPTTPESNPASPSPLVLPVNFNPSNAASPTLTAHSVKLSSRQGIDAKIDGFVDHIFAQFNRNKTWVQDQAAWALGKGSKKIVISGDIEQQLLASFSELANITGSEQAGQFIRHIAETMASQIGKPSHDKGFFENLFNDGFIKKIIKAEKDSIHKLLELIFAKVVVNLAKQTQKDPSQPVSLAEIVAKLALTLDAKLMQARQALAPCVAVIEPKAKDLAKQKAIEPLVEELMRLAFPNGAAELPVRFSAVSGKLWSVIKTHLTPQVLKLVEYQQSFKSLSTQSQAAPPHPLFNQITRGISDQALLGLQQHASTADASHLMAATLVASLHLPENEKTKEVLPWLATQIEFFFKGQNENSHLCWMELTNETQAFLNHVLSHLASHGQEHVNDPLMQIALNCLQEVDQFVSKHQTKIAAAAAFLKINGKIPENERDYIRLFKPLAVALQKHAGLMMEDKTLPLFFKTMLKTFFDKQLPEVFAKQYDNFLLPLHEMHEAIIKPESADKRQTSMTREIGAPLAAQTKVAAELLVQKLKDLMQAKQTQISDALTGKLVTEAAAVKYDFGQAINEKIGLPNPDLQGVPADELLLTPLKENAQAWLKPLLQSLTASQHPQIQHLWLFLEHRLEDIIAHLIKQTPIENRQNLGQILIHTCLGIFSEFIAQHGTDVHRLYSTLVEQGINPMTDETFIKAFVPLCEKLLVPFETLNIPDFIKANLQGLVLTEGPKLLALQYRECLVPEQALATYQARLDKLFVLNGSENRGLDHVKLIDNVCDIIAQKITLVAGREVDNKIAVFVGADKEKNTASILDLPPIQQLKNTYLKDSIKSLLIQGLVHYLEAIQINEANGSGISLASIVAKLGSVLQTHLDKDAKSIYLALKVKDPVHQQHALRAAFKPLAMDLLELIRDPHAEKRDGLPLIVPFPMLLEGVWEDLQANILPDILADMYRDTSSWQQQIEANRDAIIARTGTTYISETCRVFGQWINDFLPPFLVRDREHLIDGVYEGVSTYLAATGNASELDVDDYLRRHEATIKPMLCDMLFNTFNKQSTTLANIQPFTKEYIEAAMLKICNSLTQRIDELENPNNPKHQNDFLVNLSIRLLNIANEHFQTLNVVTSEAKKGTSHEVSHEQFIKGFARHNKLHAGMPSSEEALKAKKIIKQCVKKLKGYRKELAKTQDPAIMNVFNNLIKATQKQLLQAKKIESDEKFKFFEPFGNTLLELVNIKSAQDLPFPSPLREQLWDILQSKLLPNVLSTVFETISEPATLDKMVCSSLESLKTALDAEDMVEKNFNQLHTQATTLHNNLKASKFLILKHFPEGSAADFSTKKEWLEKLEKAIKLLKKSQQILDPSFFPLLMKDYRSCDEKIKAHFDEAKKIIASLPPIALPTAVAPKFKGIANVLLADKGEALGAVTVIEDSLRAISERLFKEEELNNKEDETQKQLNQACGGLIKELIQMVPQSMVRVLFKIDKLHNMTAEMVGRTVRRQLGSNWTLLQMIDKGVVSGMTSIDPNGSWVGRRT